MRRLLCPTALSVVALAACGGDNGGGGSAPATTVPSGQAVRVVGRDYSFDPKAIVITGGGDVRLRLANEGSLAHNLRILKGDRDLGGTATFQSGERPARVKLAPGEYRMVCTVGNHEDLGMKGSLRVRARN